MADDHSYGVGVSGPDGSADGIGRAQIDRDGITLMRIEYDRNLIDEDTFRMVHVAIVLALSGGLKQFEGVR